MGGGKPNEIKLSLGREVVIGTYTCREKGKFEEQAGINEESWKRNSGKGMGSFHLNAVSHRNSHNEK